MRHLVGVWNRGFLNSAVATGDGMQTLLIVAGVVIAVAVAALIITNVVLKKK